MAEDRPGGEPTEEPTPRRLKQAREKGQIARSGDLTSAAAFAAAWGALLVGGGALLAQLAAVVRGGITRAAAGGGDLAAEAALRGALGDTARLTAPVLGAAVVAAGVVGYLQAGGLFTLKPVFPQGKRVNPLEGAKRILSKKTLFELAKSLAKLAALGGVVWWTIAPRLPELPRLAGAPADAALAWTAGVAGLLVLRVALLYVLIGAADYLWQRRVHRKELRMTREEVKREHKEQEGEPQHKAERQRLHRDLLQHQMVESVRTADCVIVNPDHIAVALRFDEETMGAPQVVAKGERLVAHQIKEVARRHGVPIYRDVALARALHELELGEEIPEALYEAVAEVLRLVWREAGGDGGGT
jgi:flagellar biosynthesis protein FlhB